MQKKKTVKTTNTGIGTPLPYLYRLVVLGDVHLRSTDPLGILNEDNINTRLLDKLTAIAQAVTHAVNNKATHFILLGDVFDAINPSEVLKRLFWEAITPAIEANIEIRIIIGNHDRTGRMFNFSGDEPIMPKNIAMVKHDLLTETLTLPNRTEPLSIKYIPYKAKEEIVKDLATFSDITFGHFEIDGALLAPDNREMHHVIAQSACTSSLTWLGHIHKFQEFNDHFAYLGSCVQSDFAEVHDKKFFGQIDIDDHGSLNYSFHNIIQRPMYQHLIEEVDENNLYITEKAPEELKQEGVLIKFILQGSPEWIKSIDKLKLKARFPKATRVLVDSTKLDHDRQQETPKKFKMEDHVYKHLADKKKSKDYLTKGLEIAKYSYAHAEEVE